MFKPKIAPAPVRPEVLAVQTAEEALAEARRTAAETSARSIAVAESAAAEARTALAAADERERRKPIEERSDAAFARVGSIDSAIQDALNWLATILRERDALEGEIYSTSRALGQLHRLLSPSLELHSVIVRPGSADIHVSWPR